MKYLMLIVMAFALASCSKPEVKVEKVEKVIVVDKKAELETAQLQIYKHVIRELKRKKGMSIGVLKDKEDILASFTKIGDETYAISSYYETDSYMCVDGLNWKKVGTVNAEFTSSMFKVNGEWRYSVLKDSNNNTIRGR
jgi:hypothetical protein